MATGKTFQTALILSTIAHTCFFAGGFSWIGRVTRPDAVSKDYIFIQLEARPAAPPASGPADRRSVGADSRAIPAREPARTTQPDVRTAKPASPPAAPQKISGKGTVTSKELLSDPKKGQIFSQYFQSIKSRIQTVAARHQTFVVRERGKVEIDFVLGPDGHVLSVTPRPDSPGAKDPLLLNRALDIINESEPFSSFPSDIQVPSISFNITLVFDG